MSKAFRSINQILNCIRFSLTSFSFPVSRKAGSDRARHPAQDCYTPTDPTELFFWGREGGRGGEKGRERRGSHVFKWASQNMTKSSLYKQSCVSVNYVPAPSVFFWWLLQGFCQKEPRLSVCPLTNHSCALLCMCPDPLMYQIHSCVYQHPQGNGLMWCAFTQTQVQLFYFFCPTRWTGW